VQVDLAPRIDRLLVPDPIVAWRGWSLTGRSDGSKLRIGAVTGRKDTWPPLRATRATCKRGRSHPAPHLGCRCGLYATHNTELLRRTKTPAVIGTIAMWGRVIEHENGYRAQLAYPQRLRLVCSLCFWQWGEHSGRPEAVAVMPRGRLLPFCAGHLAAARRYGLRWSHAISAASVQDLLQTVYAVDVLPT